MGVLLEEQSGVEIDVRLAAYIFSEDSSIDFMLQTAGFPVPIRDQRLWRFNAVYGLFWSRGYAVRSSHLQFGNRFDRVPRIFERLLLAPWLTPTKVPIKSSDPAWREKLMHELTSTGHSAVECRASDSNALREVLSHISLNPVQLEYLNLYCRVSGITRGPDTTVIALETPTSA